MTLDHLRSGVDVPFYKSLIAGSLSGIVARTFTAPLDVIKIHYQLLPRNIATKKTTRSTLHGNNDIKLFNIIKKIYKAENSIKGFFKGNVPGLLMYMVYGSVQFSSYSYFNSHLSIFTKNEALHSFIVGGLSGICSSVVSYPLDILRTRFIAFQKHVPTTNHISTVSRTNNNRMFDVVKEIWLHENKFNGLFKGCTSSIVTLTLNSSIIFSVYESINVFCENYSNSKNNENTYIMLLRQFSSTIAGITAKSVTFPLDTIRRRIQIMTSRNITELTESPQVYKEYHKKKKFISIGYHIYRKEGIKTLYQGLYIALLKSAPTTVISLYVYERVLNILR
ncbi:thiamine transporter TPC1 SCDLUD_002342 [Saccharomycodes ludwigii]|uniref:thiamine transporter TPC1 n=1 Tax=Saccharomycodes ludwigii TaxID=36035 RepID=UPI001E81C503|nr:hypothetical protein SCDLUD_002342 [Saccharomycodes ludwigii]KAH3900884.1 hypothetical protein SCDLUD_002342 [Saccharomycodes ludwigii]